MELGKERDPGTRAKTTRTRVDRYAGEGPRDRGGVDRESDDEPIVARKRAWEKKGKVPRGQSKSHTYWVERCAREGPDGDGGGEGCESDDEPIVAVARGGRRGGAVEHGRAEHERVQQLQPERIPHPAGDVRVARLCEDKNRVVKE